MQPTPRVFSRNRDAPMCSPSGRKTKKPISHVETGSLIINLSVSTPMRIRTSNLLIRSQMLYPIELWALDSVRLAPYQKAAVAVRSL